MKYILAMLLCLTYTAAFGAVPGESAYCLANCIEGFCQPVVFRLGQANAQIGLPLGVTISLGTGNSEIVPANSYAWAWTAGPHGTPGNLPGLGSDIADNYEIPKVTMSDSGLYVEVGYASGGSDTLNWCVTVNPVAVLNNNLNPLP